MRKQNFPRMLWEPQMLVQPTYLWFSGINETKCMHQPEHI